MRLLHRLDGTRPGLADGRACPTRGSLVVEIYTRVFIRLAGLSGRKVRSREPARSRRWRRSAAAPAALAREPNDHETDVLIAAAGLRAIAGRTGCTGRPPRPDA